jgi:ABC-type sugar transport system permease subunit
MTQALAPAALAAPRRRSRRSDRRGLILFSLPSVIWYLIFTIGPLVAMFVLSLFRWQTLVGTPEFIGVENYINLPQASQFQAAIIITPIHLVGSIPIMMFAAFMIGYYLNLKPAGHRILRVLMFAPALISVSALGTMFIAVLGPKGLLNGLLAQVGLESWTRAWLGDPQTALLCIILITIWSGTGFNAILISARLAAIDDDVYQAAELDGAGHWRKMWSVAFPIMSDYFGVLTMLQYLWALFGSAGMILLLTSGGPGVATTTLSWMVYQNAFITNKIGFSQAVGVLLFALGVVGLLIIRRVFRPRY